MKKDSLVIEFVLIKNVQKMWTLEVILYLKGRQSQRSSFGSSNT